MRFLDFVGGIYLEKDGIDIECHAPFKNILFFVLVLVVVLIQGE
jgi:hypothetical protein